MTVQIEGSGKECVSRQYEVGEWARHETGTRDEPNDRCPYIFAADGLDHIVGRSAEEFGDDGELVDVILAGEERLALEHLSEDAARAPDVDLDVILLPCEHDLGGAIVSGRHVTRHLRVLYSGETEVADLEVTVLVDEDVAGFQIPMDDTGGVDIFQTTLDVFLAGANWRD